MRVLITRPTEDAIITAKILKNAGLNPIICPLLKIKLIKKINYKSTYLVTSKNALPAILNKESKLYVLGKNTASIAKDMGFREIIFLGETIEEVKSVLPRDEKIIYASALDVSDELIGLSNVSREVVYQAIFSDDNKDELYKFLSIKQKKIILLFSLRTAEQLTKLISGLNFDYDDIIFITIARKISEFLKDNGYKNIYNPDTPTLESMLDLIKRVI